MAVRCIQLGLVPVSALFLPRFNAGFPRLANPSAAMFSHALCNDETPDSVHLRHTTVPGDTMAWHSASCLIEQGCNKVSLVNGFKPEYLTVLGHIGRRACSSTTTRGLQLAVRLISFPTCSEEDRIRMLFPYSVAAACCTIDTCPLDIQAPEAFITEISRLRQAGDPDMLAVVPSDVTEGSCGPSTIPGCPSAISR